jgi:hypothetical protein
MPRFSWELTPDAANGSNEALGDIFGLGKKKPPAPWDSKDPILVNHRDPKAILRKITVELPADRYESLDPRKVVLEAQGPDDTSINRMDMLRAMIRTAYLQKKWTEEEVKQIDKTLERIPPQPGSPWLYERMADNVFDNGLAIDDRFSTNDSVYLVLLTD